MRSETISIDTQLGGKLVRLVRPSVVVLCGPAACGKSTFAEHHFRPTQIISSDWARGRVCDDERDQRFNAQAFALVHFLVEQRLALNRLCVVDSTALTGPARQELLSLAKKRQVPAVAMVFDVSLEKCVERDQKRERSVGRPVIERQHQAFEQAKAAIRQEGFDQLLEFKDGDLDQLNVEIVFRPVARPIQRPPRPEPANARRFDRPVPSAPAGAGVPGVIPTVRSAPVSQPPVPTPVAVPRSAAIPSGTTASAAKPQAQAPAPPAGAGSQPTQKSAPDPSARPTGVSPTGRS